MTAGILAELARIRIVPVVVLDRVEHAEPMARALASGGIGCAEITLRTPAGIDAISAASRVGGFLVGAGTVLTASDVDHAVDAGARFVVSPGVDDAVVRQAHQRGVAVLPGVATATEVQRCLAMGLDHLKLFPASSLGGPSLISALAGPFPNARFLPSGGVGLTDAPDYLALPGVFAVSGSWMVPREVIRVEDFDSIRRLAAQASSELRG